MADAVPAAHIRAAIVRAAAHFGVDATEVAVTGLAKRRHRTARRAQRSSPKRVFYGITVQDEHGTLLVYRFHDGGEVELVWPNSPLPGFDGKSG